MPLGRLCRAEAAWWCVRWLADGWRSLRARIHPRWAPPPPGARGPRPPPGGAAPPTAPRVTHNPASSVCPPDSGCSLAPWLPSRQPCRLPAPLDLRLRHYAGRLPPTGPVERSPSVCMAAARVCVPALGLAAWRALFALSVLVSARPGRLAAGARLASLRAVPRLVCASVWAVWWAAFPPRPGCCVLSPLLPVCCSSRSLSCLPFPSFWPSPLDLSSAPAVVSPLTSS